jgi:hypothetical protein
VRTVYLVRVQSTAVGKSWNGFNVFVTGMAEFNVGIMCACAPSIQHFVKSFGHSVSTMVSSFSGHSIGGRGQVRPRMKGSSELDSGINSIEVVAEKANGFGNGSAEHKQVVSPASSRSPLTSFRRGAGSNITRQGVCYDGYDRRDGGEDWTNSSKLVV